MSLRRQLGSQTVQHEIDILQSAFYLKIDQFLPQACLNVLEEHKLYVHHWCELHALRTFRGDHHVDVDIRRWVDMFYFYKMCTDL